MQKRSPHSSQLPTHCLAGPPSSSAARRNPTSTPEGAASSRQTLSRCCSHRPQLPVPSDEKQRPHCPPHAHRAQSGSLSSPWHRLPPPPLTYTVASLVHTPRGACYSLSPLLVPAIHVAQPRCSSCVGPRPRLPREFHPRLCSLSSSPPRHVPSPCPIPRCCLVSAVIPRGRDRAKWAAGLPNMRVVWKRTMTRWGARCNQCLGGVWGRRAETVVCVGGGGILQLTAAGANAWLVCQSSPASKTPLPAVQPPQRAGWLTSRMYVLSPTCPAHRMSSPPCGGRPWHTHRWTGFQGPHTGDPLRANYGPKRNVAAVDSAWPLGRSPPDPGAWASAARSVPAIHASPWL